MASDTRDGLMQYGEDSIMYNEVSRQGSAMSTELRQRVATPLVPPMSPLRPHQLRPVKLEPPMQYQPEGDTSRCEPTAPQRCKVEAPVSLAAANITPTVNNIVASVNLGCPLDLKAIAARARNVEYSPSRIFLRIRQPIRATFYVTKYGKLVVLGVSTVENCRIALRRGARIIQNLGYDVKFLNFKVFNIQASFSMGFKLNLEELHLMNSQFCSLEPEMFPSVVYKMSKPRVTLHIFVSGKVTVVGAKTLSDVHDAFNNIYPILRGFRKKQ